MKGGGFVFIFNTSGSGSKLYYAFKAIHALKAFTFSCACHLNQSPDTWKLSFPIPSLPLPPDGRELKILVGEVFYNNFFFFQWHWMLLILSKREAMKMQGNPPGSNIHFTFSTSNKIAALNVDEKECQILHISFLIRLALKFIWI